MMKKEKVSLPDVSARNYFSHYYFPVSREASFSSTAATAIEHISVRAPSSEGPNGHYKGGIKVISEHSDDEGYVSKGIRLAEKGGEVLRSGRWVKSG